MFNCVVSLFIDLTKSYDQIWIIGDEFLMKASGHLTKERLEISTDQFYIRMNYNVKVYAATSLDVIKNPLGKICNQLVKAVNEIYLLPKIILVVTEDNIINHIGNTENGMVSETYGCISHWLVAEFNKIIDAKKEFLPHKAIRLTYPQFVWMAPAQHCDLQGNNLCYKMGMSMKKSLDIMPNHMLLFLKKVWDFNDTYSIRHGHFMAEGYLKYWKLTDSAIEFWNRHLAPGAAKKKQHNAHGKPLHSSTYHHRG